MFGAHLNTTNIITSANKIRKYGGNIFQFMLSNVNERQLGNLDNLDNNMSRDISPLGNPLGSYLKDNNISCVIHSSYTHNIAKNWNPNSWWIESIINEINYAGQIGAYGVVIHFGKLLDMNMSVAYNNMYSALLYINGQTSKYNDTLILLETTSSQGTELCSKLEDLALFFNKLKNIKRFKICIDTCHIFQAGYDIRNENSFKLYLETFEELIGLNKIGMIHLNDSMKDLGCKRDRHQSIGNGYIGYIGLLLFYKYFINKVPIILETPNNSYKTEIKLIKNI